jgi:hypothetical protein
MYQIIILLRDFVAKIVTAETVNLTTENDILHGISNGGGIIVVSFAPFVV